LVEAALGAAEASVDSEAEVLAVAELVAVGSGAPRPRPALLTLTGENLWFPLPGNKRNEWIQKSKN
jgi:hypothetical protein